MALKVVFQNTIHAIYKTALYSRRLKYPLHSRSYALSKILRDKSKQCETRETLNIDGRYFFHLRNTVFIT